MYPVYLAWDGLLWLLFCSLPLLSALPSLTFLGNGTLPAFPLLAHYNLSTGPDGHSVESPFPICDPERAGQQLNRISCEEAFLKIPTSRGLLEFARGNSFIEPDVQLPRRYSSCK